MLIYERDKPSIWQGIRGRRIKKVRNIHWTEEQDKRLMELRKTHSQKETARLLTKEFKRTFTRNGVKNREFRLLNKEKLKTAKFEYKETIEILSDGSHKSDKLLRMDANQCKDVNFLLQAHGYNIDKWELVSARNNIWNTYSKQDGIQTLYSSKITVKPKLENDFKNLIEVIKNQKPIRFNPTKREVKPRLLEIAPVDPHFGISSFEYYKPNLERIINKIRSRHWEEIIIPVGNDLFHNDDFRGRTSSGREIEKVGMSTAWKEAKQFYYPIIEESIKHSNKVKVIYVRGNHDESMSWAFVDNLITRFPELDYDHEFKEHKAHIFHDVFIGLTHGDKNRKNTAKIFNSKFRMEIARAKVREIHLAHLHGEDANTIDDYGIMVRTLPTQNKEDEWHDQNGYVGKNKRFQIFEYSTDKLESIHYV